MEFGVHLPQIGFDGPDWSLDRLREYVRLADDLGFTHLCANDHLLFPEPWLDGPTALVALLGETDMALATTIANPVVRHPAVLTKALDAIDLLSGGRLVVGVGPGSSNRDYEAVGIPFEERWPRFDESVRALRSLLQRGEAFDGEWYSTAGIELEPRAAQRPGPPLWIGSWGSRVGLRRVARLGDGWLASGYNTTPERFREGKERLDAELLDVGRNPDGFPNAIATMFCHVTEDPSEADRVVRDTLAPTLGRPPEELADRLLVGSPDACADRLEAYRGAGAERVLLWPVGDELAQLRTVHEDVTSGLGG